MIIFFVESSCLLFFFCCARRALKCIFNSGCILLKEKNEVSSARHSPLDGWTFTLCIILHVTCCIFLQCVFQHINWTVSMCGCMNCKYHLIFVVVVLSNFFPSFFPLFFLLTSTSLMWMRYRMRLD